MYDDISHNYRLHVVAYKMWIINIHIVLVYT